MRLRAVAFVLALLVGATPLAGIVCAMDCDRPPATSLPCHDAAVPHGTTLHGAPHACDQDHAAASPARLTTVSAMDSGGPSIGALGVRLPPAILPGSHVAGAGRLHDRPGLSAGRLSSSITVLRI